MNIVICMYEWWNKTFLGYIVMVCKIQLIYCLTFHQITDFVESRYSEYDFKEQ